MMKKQMGKGKYSFLSDVEPHQLNTGYFHLGLSSDKNCQSLPLLFPHIILLYISYSFLLKKITSCAFPLFSDFAFLLYQVF